MHFKTIYLLCILEARSIGILLAYCLDLNDIILLCCKKVSLLRAHFIRIKLSANLPFLNRINNYYNEQSPRMRILVNEGEFVGHFYSNKSYVKKLQK